VRLEIATGHKLRYTGKDFDIHLDLADPLSSVEGHADSAVELRWLRQMEMIRIGRH